MRSAPLGTPWLPGPVLLGMVMVPVTTLLTTGVPRRVTPRGGIVAGDEVVIEQRERIGCRRLSGAAGDEQFDGRAETDLGACGGIGGDNASGGNDAAGCGADGAGDQTRAREGQACCGLRKSDDVGNRGCHGLAIDAADAAEIDGLERNRRGEIQRVVAENRRTGQIASGLRREAEVHGTAGAGKKRKRGPARGELGEVRAELKVASHSAAGCRHFEGDDLRAVSAGAAHVGEGEVQRGRLRAVYLYDTGSVIVGDEEIARRIHRQTGWNTQTGGGHRGLDATG